jgi:predicted ArsR family transcriptional regulator
MAKKSVRCERYHVHLTMAAILKLGGRKSGDVRFSLDDVAQQTGASRDRVRSHLRQLQKLGVLKLKFPANKIAGTEGMQRRPTYQINAEPFEAFRRSAPPVFAGLYTA